MGMYSEQQIKEAFIKQYEEEHGNIIGAHDAYEWWRNPLLKCAIEDSKRGKKCRIMCVYCKK